ncbi:hypothetical protein TWF569_003325 [Orbilia oligospora]|nr:hypothetical protein TWF569_003325 [Orbilia oligospora]
MRIPGGRNRLFVGFVSQLAIFNSVFGIANVPKYVFEGLVADPTTKSAFGHVGIAIGNLVNGVLNSTEVASQTLPAIVDRFTTKLKIVAETIEEIPVGDLQRYGFASLVEAKVAVSTLMEYRGYIFELPQTPVLRVFKNIPVPIPQDFWNPNDKTPEKYSIEKPAQLYPMLEKMAKYFENAGIEYDNYRAVMQWIFAGRYDATNDTEDLDLDFYDQFVDGVTALNSNAHDVLEEYVGVWVRISSRFTLGGGLDSSFYEDQRDLQAYLENRWTELKALMTEFWRASGFIGMVRIYEPYVEPPPKEKKKKKGKEY